LLFTYIVPKIVWKMSRIISKTTHSIRYTSGTYHQSFLKLGHLRLSTVKCIPIWQAIEQRPKTIDHKMQSQTRFHCKRKYETSYKILVTMKMIGAETQKEMIHLPLRSLSMFSESPSAMLRRARISTQKKYIE